MRIFRLFGTVLAALLLAAAAAGICAASERITSFESDVTVHPDSTMTVTETISVIAGGANIKHGIYRDFPTEYRTPSGRRYVTSFDVTAVTCDGRPEDHFMKSRKNGRRLYIGDKDTLVTHGNHTYTITYNTDRQLGIFPLHDELYWNVTGNGWIFPIHSVTATIRPPDGARVTEVVAYTGHQGEKGDDYKAYVGEDGSAVFRTTRPLDAYEGLTVVAKWPKGFVSEPDAMTKLLYEWRDTRHIVVALFCITVVFLYYLAAWIKVGRDPAKGFVVVQYDPPDGLSPAAMRHIRRRGYDPKAFTAAIVNLGVKGFIEINQTGKKKYELKRTGRDATSAGEMSPGEAKVFKRLFGHARMTVKLDGYKDYVGKAAQDLKDKLKAEYSRKYFLRNIEYILPGTALSVLGVFWCSREFYFLGDDFLGMAGGALAFSIGAAFLGRVFTGAWSGFFSSRNFTNFIMSVWTSIFFLGISGACIFFWAATFTDAPGAAALLLAMAVINIVFFFIMDAPTVMGRMVLDRIEGFRVFLKATEEDRLNMLNPPERTPELFESLLPYAIALDCENDWADQFRGAVMESAIEKQTSTWYHGTGRLHGESFAGSMTGSLTSSLGGAISSSATAPGSSGGGGGGFSGGGSSGGGGGGGGGGGW